MTKYLLPFILCLAAMPASTQTQTPGCFGALNSYSVAFAPQAILSADFNNDGHIDLATANVGTNNVSVLLGTGTGSFSPMVNYMAANGLYAITSADFNGDGNADLATVNGGGYQVLFGTGTGSFGSPAGSGTNYAPVDIVAGDFNGDGKPDLALVNTIQNYNVSVLINTGSGNFAPEVTYSTLSAFKIVTADFNGDGKLDLAVGRNGNSNQSDISVLYGTGTGSFSNAVNFYPGGIYVSGIAASDFNNDGKADIAITSYNSNVLVVSLAGSTGNFVTGTTYTVGSGPRGIFPADYNSDGKIDLAVSNYSSSNISVLHGTGTGGFGTPDTYTVGNKPTGITAADFNGDNKPDLAASLDYYSAVVLLNTSSSVTLTASSFAFCAGGSSTLLASGANSYTWTGGPNTNTYAVNPLTTTIYSVAGTNSAGCVSSTATLNITVKPLPTITFSGTGTSLCVGDSTSIYAAGASAYVWNNSAQTQAISFIATGSSTFSVTGTSTLTGCSATATLQVNASACTGISEQTTHRQITLFPNPADNRIELRIENAGSKNVSAELFNTNGEVLKTFKVLPQGDLDISSLCSGIYFLRVNNQVLKFVKQ